MPSEALEVSEVGGRDRERQLALVAINQNGPIELHTAPRHLKIRLTICEQRSDIAGVK